MRLNLLYLIIPLLDVSTGRTVIIPQDGIENGSVLMTNGKIGHGEPFLFDIVPLQGGGNVLFDKMKSKALMVKHENVDIAQLEINPKHKEGEILKINEKEPFNVTVKILHWMDGKEVVNIVKNNKCIVKGKENRLKEGDCSSGSDQFIIMTEDDFNAWNKKRLSGAVSGSDEKESGVSGDSEESTGINSEVFPSAPPEPSMHSFQRGDQRSIQGGISGFQGGAPGLPGIQGAIQGAMQASMPSATPGVMPGMIPGSIPGLVPGAIQGVVSGTMPGAAQGMLSPQPGYPELNVGGYPAANPGFQNNYWNGPVASNLLYPPNGPLANYTASLINQVGNLRNNALNAGNGILNAGNDFVNLSKNAYNLLRRNHKHRRPGSFLQSLGQAQPFNWNQQFANNLMPNILMRNGLGQIDDNNAELALIYKNLLEQNNNQKLDLQNIIENDRAKQSINDIKNTLKNVEQKMASGGGGGAANDVIGGMASKALKTTPLGLFT